MKWEGVLSFSSRKMHISTNTIAQAGDIEYAIYPHITPVVGVKKQRDKDCCQVLVFLRSAYRSIQVDDRMDVVWKG